MHLDAFLMHTCDLLLQLHSLSNIRPPSCEHQNHTVIKPSAADRSRGTLSTIPRIDAITMAAGLTKLDPDSPSAPLPISLHHWLQPVDRIDQSYWDRRHYKSSTASPSASAQSHPRNSAIATVRGGPTDLESTIRTTRIPS